MLLLHQQTLDQFAGGRTNRGRPVDQFAWRPLGMGSMCRRHVLGDGRVEALAVAARVTGDSAPPGQDLDAATGDAQFNLLTYQGVRHAVVVVI